MSTISDKQQNFICSLISQKHDPAVAAEMISGMPWDKLTGGKSGTASALITKLMAMPNFVSNDVPDVVRAANRHGVNSSRGTCSECGHPVDAQSGFYYGPFDQGGSRWRTAHKAGECSTEPAPKPVELEEDAYYLVGDDKVVWCYRTRNGRLAGKVLSVATGGKFTYQAGALTEAATGVKLEGSALAAVAAKFGSRTGNCIFCSRELSDPRSNPASGGVGYGPTCAGKHNLPWG